LICEDSVKREEDFREFDTHMSIESSNDDVLSIY